MRLWSPSILCTRRLESLVTRQDCKHLNLQTLPLLMNTESSPIDSALSAASQTDKLVLVDFSAEWCAACKVLEAQVFTDASVIEALQNYVFVEVDTDTFPESSKTYNVVGMPTLVVLSASGEELYRNVGLITPEEFSRKLNELTVK